MILVETKRRWRVPMDVADVGLMTWLVILQHFYYASEYFKAKPISSINAHTNGDEGPMLSKHDYLISNKNPHFLVSLDFELQLACKEAVSLIRSGCFECVCRNEREKSSAITLPANPPIR